MYMSHVHKVSLRGKRILFFVAFLMMSKVAAAGTVSDYRAVPALLSEAAKPLVMLAMSNDHQLFYKSFTDYDDLDNDGIPDTTYTHSVDYIGYFDSFKCYVYDTSVEYFVPVYVTGTKYCNVAANNQWSGNFLNWASMTRMDQIRKVLFGGSRFNESFYTGITILERAALPNDAHSFAKYYNGVDLAKLTPFGDNTGSHVDVPTGLVGTQKTGITLCNTTVDSDPLSDNSSRITSPPLIRVVVGNHALWAGNEKRQCLYQEEHSTDNENDPSATGIYSSGVNPSTTEIAPQRDGKSTGDYVARVQVCRDGYIGDEDCKSYPAGNYKPIGILQKFGDSGQIDFGLITGTYNKNKSGGVLRKNVGPIDDEVSVDTDGSFKSGVGGIIETINLFRIANYDYGTGRYNISDNCPWGNTSFLDGSCTNWGNPFSEIMLECYRYFAGGSPNTNFVADDSSEIPGLKYESTWKSPISSDNLCAQLNVIAFNSSTSSYDSDSLSGFSNLNPSAGQTAKSMTKRVGDGEGISGKYFVGEHGGDTNQLCTAKEVTDLGDVRGTCPDAPRLGGSYQAAGIAYHAHVNDIRADLDEDQTVKTYGVTLSPAVPNVRIPVPNSDRYVTILPACRAHMTSGNSGNCGLVDFKIVKNYVPTGNPNEYEGAFYVNWEDTEQGGDYDMDMYGMIRYTIDSTDIVVETDVVYKAASIRLGFGFVISGTKDDGFHVMSGINFFTEGDCTNCLSTDAPITKSFTIGDSDARLLEQPLYYASKWGGFTDRDGDGTPNLQEEWDKVDNVTGEVGSDGIPDSYFLAINPKQLQTQLTKILVSILERTASGTSAAVVTNTGAGEGALYQALYNSRYSGANGIDAVEWVGTLNALFIDRYGNIREDNALPKGQLTDADSVIDVYYDASLSKTQLQRYFLAADGSVGAADGPARDVSEIQPMWSAGEELSKVSDFVSQRTPYTENAHSGRYILTSIDKDGDGLIGMGSAMSETEDFVAETFNPVGSQNFRLLGLKSSNMADFSKIVNYIRGAAVPGYRNRRVDVDNDGKLEPLVLGDIVHSSPVAVSRPTSGFDLTYGDETYKTYRQQYQYRRQVVYTGANDGMLHAFNGGFYNPIDSTYELTVNGHTAHPLGAELWAYVPYNLLPHLQWLTLPDYPHVYYMDGSIKTYDVNIFPDDAVHPGGWGTILVAGMRFGGGEYTLDPDDDNDLDPSDDITLRSGYVILDITDPESPPTVLAEITHEDMGYTVAEPTLVKMRAADPLTGSYATPYMNDWYIVMASGPAGSNDIGRANALQQATSQKSAKIFVYDLKNHSLSVHDTGQAASFVGGVHTTDWNRDYIDDTIYFGTVSGTIDSPTGSLLRGQLTRLGGKLDINFGQVLDVTNQPFSATPLSVRDRLGNYWVYSGTGRFYVEKDNYSTQQQSFYGIKEKQSSGVLVGAAVNKVDLINTSDIDVYTDGTIDSKSAPGSAINLDGNVAKTFLDVQGAVENSDGWFFDLSRYRSRNITQAVVSDQSLVFTEYQPSGLQCEAEGLGFLNAPHLQAGVPGPFAALGSDSSTVNADGGERVNLATSLGLGSPSAPSIHQRGDGKKLAVTQNSTGELSTTIIEAGKTAGARESWRELEIDWE